jgi:hypothetical protein
MGPNEYHKQVEELHKIIPVLDLCKMIVEMNSYCSACNYKYCLIVEQVSMSD